LKAEVWQFGIMLAGFCGIAILWLKVIYLPRRTMERWRHPKPNPRDAASGKSEAADDREGS